jgi:hypothetical protein
MGITDGSKVTLARSLVEVDSLCFYFDAATMTNLTTCAGADAFMCEGAPAMNHSTNIDASLERRPGGAAGNGLDTDNNLLDFQMLMPTNPQNLASPPTP